MMRHLDVIRLRPGMYAGDTQDGSGMHQLLWQVVGRALDQHLHGGAARLDVRIDGDRVTVEDDGAGEPPTALASRFHSTHASERFHGAGLVYVPPLSERFEVHAVRDGRRHRADFERGELVGDAWRDEGQTTTGDGTRVSFEPDFGLFTRRAWDVDTIRERLLRLAATTPRLAIRLQGDRLAMPDGLADLVRQRARVHEAPLRVLANHAGVGVEVALAWTTDPAAPMVDGFAHHVPAPCGTHVDGFWRGLRRLLPAPAVSTAAYRTAIGAGLVAAVHVDLTQPRFITATRDCLDNPEARTAVAHVVARHLALPSPLAACLRARLA
jgi:DNA gyrase subunit B